MDITAVIALTGAFQKLVGETLADLKSIEIARGDIELLRLKRSMLGEELE